MSLAARPPLETIARSVPLRARIVSELRQAIEAGILKPGDRLVERDISRQLAVSRTTLREALRVLHIDGVLVAAETRGLAVAGSSVRDANNAYQCRAALEALIVEQFIERADDDERWAVREQGERLKLALAEGDIEEILAAKRDFYQMIGRGARNGLAFDLLANLVLRTSGIRYRSLARDERKRQSIEEIDLILRAIDKRDVAMARRAAFSHVASAAQFFAEEAG